MELQIGLMIIVNLSSINNDAIAPNPQGFLLFTIKVDAISLWGGLYSNNQLKSEG
jgi:hypothetical protein